MTNKRFEMYEYRQVLVRMRMGESNRAIAEAGLMGRKKAQKLRDLAQAYGWLEPLNSLPDNTQLATVLNVTVHTPSSAISSVMPHADKVNKWIEDGVQGTTIHHKLVNSYGFTGSYWSVNRYIKSVVEQQPGKVSTVMEFDPGDAAQVDFGAGPLIVDTRTGEMRKTWVFIMTLAWSRHIYAEFIWDQSVATWLSCHRRSFEWFNGVPKRVIIDNPKCAITKACYHDPDVQRAYAECAEGYGFLIAPCPVRDPQKKGRVESNVKYVKNAFVPLREFRSISDANAQLREWVMAVAGNRNHGTTRRQPLTQFKELEQSLLKPLPETSPEHAVWAKVKVHGDGHVQFELARYSVPYQLIRETLWLRASDTSVRIYQTHELKASHPRFRHSGARSTIAEHQPPSAQAYNMQDPQYCLREAKKVGEYCHLFIERLFASRVLDNLRAAQGVVGFAKRYGHMRLENACARALTFDNVRYSAIKQILEKGLDELPHETNAFDSLSDSYTGKGRFHRDPNKLIPH
jgi:transposase